MLKICMGVTTILYIDLYTKHSDVIVFFTLLWCVDKK